MTYTVQKVLAWHNRSKLGHRRRRWAKTTVLHSGPYPSLEEAVKVRASLNSGKKQQQYWVLDSKGQVC